MEIHRTEFVAGIDGGGTKTAVVCWDMEGNFLTERVFTSFNFNSIGEENFVTLLTDICGFLQQQGQCRALCIGAAGISNPRVRTLVAQAMDKTRILNWQLVGDQEIAQYGALEGREGICLVAGTGSICYGHNKEGASARAGGWGHLIGDEGSGYAIGRDALRAVVCQWDGCGEQTSLTQAVERELGLDDRQKMIAYVYGNDKSSVAAVAPLAEQEAKRGDGMARAILQRNAYLLAELVGTVAERLEQETGEVALLGGLLTNDTLFRQFVKAAVEERCEGFRCVPPRQNGAVGAVMMAAELVLS